VTTAFDNIFAKSGGVADQLVSKFGTPATLVRETKTYDAATGKNTVSTTSYSLKVTPPIAGVDTVGAYRKDSIVGSTVGMYELTVSFAAVSLPIEPNATTDKMIFRGTTYQIVRVLPIVSGDDTALWYVQLRA
jgi:hypothetical protein